jgi:2-methylisocitrate lyase-like PEP mutase family enzyme
MTGLQTATKSIVPLSINPRTDVYLRGLATGRAAVAMAVERLAMFQVAGADCGFVPGLASVEDTAAIAAAVKIPLNLMALLDLDTMRLVGVRRVSAGPALFQLAYGTAQSAARSFMGGHLGPMFQATLDYNATNALFTAVRRD